MALPVWLGGAWPLVGVWTVLFLSAPAPRMGCRLAGLLSAAPVLRTGAKRGRYGKGRDRLSYRAALLAAAGAAGRGGAQSAAGRRSLGVRRFQPRHHSIGRSDGTGHRES